MSRTRGRTERSLNYFSQLAFFSMPTLLQSRKSLQTQAYLTQESLQKCWNRRPGGCEPLRSFQRTLNQTWKMIQMSTHISGKARKRRILLWRCTLVLPEDWLEPKRCRLSEAERGMHQDGKDFRNMWKTKGSHVSNSLEKLHNCIARFGSSTKVFRPTRIFFISEEVSSRWALSFPWLMAFF